MIMSFLQDHRLALSGHIPGKDFPYSDHEGVEVTFELSQREASIPVKERIFDGKRKKMHRVHSYISLSLSLSLIFHMKLSRYLKKSPRTEETKILYFHIPNQQLVGVSPHY